MKRGKIKNKKKIIVIVAIIILIIILFFTTRKFTGFATSTSLYSCNDSDNGINYFEKGFCEDRKQEYEDQCYGERGLWEYYCSKDKYTCIRQESACPYECQDGACKRRLCTDSDEGKNYGVKGTVNLNSKEYLDYCLEDNKTLMEYYCSGNSTYDSLSFECDSGCVDGACVNSSVNNENTNVIPEENPPAEKNAEKTSNYDYVLIVSILIFLVILAVFLIREFRRKRR